jgi:very-short-patch-repair endonuclease
MRCAPTRSEQLLWQALRHASLGVRFRRQVVLGPFIADFFAPAARLVVEVDGGVHIGQRRRDELRDLSLRAQGLRVLRLDAALVERDVAAALAVVRAALAEAAPAALAEAAPAGAAQR